MKKYALASLLVLMSYASAQGQNLEKIKGNRTVSTVQTDISSFHTISIDEDFNIDLIFNITPFVEIETDENLHEIIEFLVKDSILNFNKLKKITSKKRLKIKIGYDKALQHIKIKDKAEIVGLIPLTFSNASLETSGSSKTSLTIKTGNFKFKSEDRAKVKLNITADTCVINMRGTGKLEALLNTSQLDAFINERADAIIEGNCNTSTIELDNNTTFNGKNFTLNTCNINSNLSSTAYLEVTENITINASGNSAIYLYLNPKIIISSMLDTAKLQKKVK